MIIQSRIREAIEFSLVGRTSVTLEDVGHEYRRRSPSGGTIVEDGGGKSVKSWIEGELSDTFSLTEIDQKPAVKFVSEKKTLTDTPVSIEEKLEILSSLKIGTGIAERSDDAAYAFLPTKAWRAFADDTHDIFVGAKGSGKSQLLKHAFGIGQGELPTDVRIIHIDAARDQYLLPPRVALKQLSVEAHKGIWLLLLGLKAYLWVKKNAVIFDVSEIESVLHETGFIEDKEMTGRKNRIVSFLVDLSRNIEFSAKAEISGIGSIEFKPSEQEIDSAALMRRSERACIKFLSDLTKSRALRIWFVIDRTDILFDGDRDLELQSLHALLSIVRDDIGNVDAYTGFKAKLLLKRDVWNSLARRGIPEFSHLVARRVELVWTLFELQRVIAGRFAKNPHLMDTMRIKEGAAVKSRVTVEDFLIQLLMKGDLPDRGKTRKPADWILNSLRDATGYPTPRDYIQFFRKVIDCERDQLEREGGDKWGRRHIFQQYSLIQGRKLLGLEKLEVLIGEFPAMHSLVEFVKREGKRVLTDDQISAVLGKPHGDALDRVVSLGFLRFRAEDGYHEVPWFYFDALLSRDRQVALGYEVPNTKTPVPEIDVSAFETVVGFIRGVFTRIEGKEAVLALGRRVRLPAEAIGVLREFGWNKESVDFWIHVSRRGYWIIDASRPLIVGCTYQFKIGGPSGEEVDEAVCIDDRLGVELCVAAQGFINTDLGKVATAVISGLDGLGPVCLPDVL